VPPHPLNNDEHLTINQQSVVRRYEFLSSRPIDINVRLVFSYRRAALPAALIPSFFLDYRDLKGYWHLNEAEIQHLLALMRLQFVSAE
jgi:hypothetical protein